MGKRSLPLQKLIFEKAGGRSMEKGGFSQDSSICNGRGRGKYIYEGNKTGGYREVRRGEGVGGWGDGKLLVAAKGIRCYEMSLVSSQSAPDRKSVV